MQTQQEQKKANRTQVSQRNSTAMDTKMDDNKNVFGTLLETLPSESRAQLSQITTEAKGAFARVKSYAKKNPYQTAGIAAVGVGALWFFARTQPGKNLYMSGKRLIGSQLDRWTSKSEKNVVQH